MLWVYCHYMIKMWRIRVIASPVYWFCAFLIKIECVSKSFGFKIKNWFFDQMTPDHSFRGTKWQQMTNLEKQSAIILENFNFALPCRCPPCGLILCLFDKNWVCFKVIWVQNKKLIFWPNYTRSLIKGNKMSPYDKTVTSLCRCNCCAVIWCPSDENWVFSRVLGGKNNYLFLDKMTTDDTFRDAKCLYLRKF